MNKRKKTAKGKDISQAEKMCCYTGYTGGYGYADRGLAFVLMTAVITTMSAVVDYG